MKFFYGTTMILIALAALQLLWFNAVQSAVQLSVSLHHEKVRELNDDLATNTASLNLQNTKVYAPVILGAGRGTTGTHLFTSATCKLGYPSIHFNTGCLPTESITVIDTTTDTIEISDPMKAIYQRHSSLMSDFSTRTVKHSIAKSLRDNILKHIDELIIETKNSNIVIALHDNPIPSLLPHFISAVQKHHELKPPIILLSKREAIEYTERRVQSHGKNERLCKNPLPFNRTTLRGGVFDLVSCIEHALDGLTPEETDIVRTEDLVYNMIKMKEEKGVDAIASEVRMYQEGVDNLSLFSYDMFAQVEKTELNDLVESIRKSIGGSFYPGVDVLELNFWRNKLIN